MCLKLKICFVNLQGKDERGLTLERITGKGFQGTKDVQWKVWHNLVPRRVQC